MSGERGFEDFSVPARYWAELVEMGVIPVPKAEEYSLEQPARAGSSRASAKQLHLLKSLIAQLEEYDGLEASRVGRQVAGQLRRDEASNLIKKTIKHLRRLERECDVC